MKALKIVLLCVLALAVLALAVFTAVYFTRIRSMSSIEKLTDYDEYNLYRMDVKYDYRVDDVIAAGITDTQSFINAVLADALPLLPVHIDAPDFACSAFTMVTPDGRTLMGRNYDFKNNTSALLVYCAPKGGYCSVATAALDNVGANDATGSLAARMACLAAPYMCLDGMNEKGLSIAVLTLDSEPTDQRTGKDVIATTLAIRLVLDRAATTEEAVALLERYDMYASSGRDYHFYITDASGDGRVVEYDCDSPARTLTATPSDAVTNFFVMYIDNVLPNQKNGVYGHGRERYDAILDVMSANENALDEDAAWEALIAASQAPKEGDVTSNTQWSIVYDDDELTAQIAIRRDFDNIIGYALDSRDITR